MYGTEVYVSVHLNFAALLILCKFVHEELCCFAYHISLSCIGGQSAGFSLDLLRYCHLTNNSLQKPVLGLTYSSFITVSVWAAKITLQVPGIVRWIASFLKVFMMKIQLNAREVIVRPKLWRHWDNMLFFSMSVTEVYVSLPYLFWFLFQLVVDIWEHVRKW